METLNKEASKIHKKILAEHAGSLITILTIVSIVIELIKLYNTCNKVGSLHDNIHKLGRIEERLIHRFIKKSVPDTKDANLVEKHIIEYITNSKKITINKIYEELNSK